MKLLEIEVDGRKKHIFALSSKNGLWVHLDGETYFFEKSKPGKSRKKQEAEGGNIFAPMPGKITKVLVKAGANVTAKKTLVIMEAMKMEYNLKAHSDGKIKSVKCNEGDQVVQDQLLVEFEKA